MFSHFKFEINIFGNCAHTENANELFWTTYGSGPLHIYIAPFFVIIMMRVTIIDRPCGGAPGTQHYTNTRGTAKNGIIYRKLNSINWSEVWILCMLQFNLCAPMPECGCQQSSLHSYGWLGSANHNNNEQRVHEIQGITDVYNIIHIK